MFEVIMYFLSYLVNLLLFLPWLMILAVPFVILGVQVGILGWLFIDLIQNGLWTQKNFQSEIELNLSREQPFQVLLVDDNPSTLIVLEKVLQSKNCFLKVAKSGFEAIEELQKTAFDLVVIDYSMPELSGPETLQKADQSFSKGFFHNLSRFNKLPVVEYTSERGHDWSLIAMSHFRVIDSLSKRMPPSQLRLKMDQLFTNLRLA